MVAHIRRKRMQQATKTRAMLCPCGSRILAGDEEALLLMFREHLEREHPSADAPPEERLEAMVSSAVYGFEYVPAGAQEGLK